MIEEQMSLGLPLVVHHDMLHLSLKSFGNTLLFVRLEGPLKAQQLWFSLMAQDS